jgi:hypothetical protein
MTATPRRVHVELLMGRRVVDPDGESVGHIAEIHAAPDDAGHLVVREYLLRRHKLLDSLSIAGVAGALVRILGGHSEHAGLKVPWDKMDLSDLRHPKTLCAASELAKK